MVNISNPANEIRKAIVSGGWNIDPDIINCYIKQLPDDELKAINLELQQSEDSSPARYVAKRVADARKADKPALLRNPTISELLKRIGDGRKGFIVAARRELRHRFPTQSFKDQKRIVEGLMSHGCADDVEFLSQYLDDPAFWKDEYIEVLTARLLSNPNQNSRFMTTFMHRADRATMLHCYKSLPVWAAYPRMVLAAKLGEDHAFEINRTDFTPEVYMYICSQTGRQDMSDQDAMSILRKSVDDSLEMLKVRGKGMPYTYEHEKEIIWPQLRDASNVVWWLSKLGKYNILLRYNAWLRKIVDEAEFAVDDNDEALKASLLQSAKALLPDL